jgi:hypothetical protein
MAHLSLIIGFRVDAGPCLGEAVEKNLQGQFC